MLVRMQSMTVDKMGICRSGAQAKLLEADGVTVINGKVDLAQFGICVKDGELYI